MGGRQEGKKEGRWAGRQAGRQENEGRNIGRKAGEQECNRQTKVQKDRCANIHTDKHKKDVLTYTDKQTDSAKVQDSRQTNRQMNR